MSEAGGGAMIDLSHLTEEEQGKILTVLRRDADLKKAEEERIRKLETILSSESQSKGKMKYLTGEWFYEAKSRRHMDKIHGSEIILASMKPRRGGSLRSESLRSESSRTAGSRGPAAAPPKPSRCPEALQPAAMSAAETSAARSPRTPRHNPFNATPPVEPPETHRDVSGARDQDSSETEPSSSQTPGPGDEAAPTSGGSVVSESAAGFKPVPKKRTFLPRGSCSRSDSGGPGGDARGGSPPGVVPAPRRRLQRGSSGSSHQSSLKTQEELPQGAAVPVSAGETSQPPLGDVSQVSPDSSRDGDVSQAPDRETVPPSIPGDRATALIGGDVGGASIQRSLGGDQQGNSVVLETSSIQDRGISSSEGTRPEELSFTTSVVDPQPPISYDLKFIDKSDQQTQNKSSQKHAFKLSTQATSPTSDEDSIAKVLDWFSRSLDSGDLLSGDETTKSSKKSEITKSKSYDEIERQTDALETKRRPSHTDRAGRTESSETREDVQKDRAPSQEVRHNDGESQPLKISHLKSFWEKSDTGPKTLPSVTSSDEGQSRVRLSAETDEENKPHMASGAPSAPAGHNGRHGDKRGQTEDSVQLTHPQQDRTLSQRNNNEISTRPQPRTESRPESESVSSVRSRGSPPQDEVHVSSKAQLRRGKSEEVKRRDSEDRNMSPKRKEDVSNKDRTSSPHSHRPESTAEKIKQLRSFWEQERTVPVPVSPGDGKLPRGANPLSKRFTRSEFDLRLVGSDSDSEDEDRQRPNLTGLPLNQRMDKLSPSLSASRSQFNNLRHFWDDAVSEAKGSIPHEKPKSPKRKEPQLPPHESKSSDGEKTRPAAAAAAARSSPQSRSKTPPDRQVGHSSNHTTAESRRGSKDSKPPSSAGKEPRSPKSRRDAPCRSASRGNSLRRATSMFTLSAEDQPDPAHMKMEVSPARPQSRKHRHNPEKGSAARRLSEGTDTAAPRARAFVPRDYRHYLGMTEQSGVHASLAPAGTSEGSEGKSGFDFDVSGPVGSSTPLSSEERYGRKGSKTSQRPLWANYSSSDTGPESSLSGASETWSRTSSNRGNDDETQNPVRKALRRAEAWPKNLAKSIEDMTTCLSPRQDSAADLRRISDGEVSTIPSPSSSLHVDPDHLKNMSKSVPSFLQKEDDDRDADSTREDSFQRGRLRTGSSMTNLPVSPLSGSVLTVYNSDFGNVEVQGNIQFSINYVQRLREFHIFVAECRDLAAVDPKRRRSDPYVKSYLVPDKSNLGKRKTSVKKKTLNPTFNEILRYRVGMEYLATQTLILSVWHHDTFGRNSFLGEVDIDLSKWDFDHTHMNDLVLKARTTPPVAPANGKGEMKLAVRFLPQVAHSAGITRDGPTTGEVHIWVKECKNLPLVRAAIDPYVKCFMLPDTSRKSRQKTRVLRRTADPVFNHTMVYDGISEADLSDACVELSVWDRDRLASNLLGGMRLGVGSGKSYGAAVDWMDSTPDEVALWERMMASPDEWVEETLPLRTVNSAKTA